MPYIFYRTGVRTTNFKYTDTKLSSDTDDDKSTSDDSINYPTLDILKENAQSKDMNVIQENWEPTENRHTQSQTGLNDKISYEVGTSPKMTTFNTHLQSKRNIPSPRLAAEEPFAEINNDKIINILQKMHADISEFRVQVLRKLNLLNMKVNDIEIAINKKETLINNEEDTNNNDFITMFPLSSETNLSDLEAILIDKNTQKSLAKHLLRIGGLDVGNMVKRLMFKIFTNDVGHLFSWDGAKGKQKFKTLRIANVIFDAVRLNHNTKNATESEIIVFIKKWLVRCKDRINLSNKKTLNKTVEDDNNL